jgi:DNA-binding transcriptional ArsR family regulator
MHGRAKSFSERFRSKNKPAEATPTTRVPRSEERFAIITESLVERLLGLEPICWPLFTILKIESVRHHGRAFVLPVDALGTVRGLSRRNLRRALTQLETHGLISVQRRASKPPIIRISEQD